jgi:hypothetical protein
MELKPFTLRLTETELSSLEKIKEIVGENTGASAIRAVLRNYIELKTKLDNSVKENAKLRSELSATKNKVKNFTTAYSELLNIDAKRNK